MTVSDVVRALGGRLASELVDAGRVVQGGYASDLLSDVIANAHEGDLWVTLQRHANIVAVAHLKGLVAVVLVNGRQPEPETTARAVEAGVPIITTSLSTFEAVGVLHKLGVRGRGSTESVRA